jgi:hypothetical protein
MKPACLFASLLACLPAVTQAQAVAAPPPRVNVAELHQAIKAARLQTKGDEEKTATFEARRANFRFKKLAIGDEMMAVFRPAATPGCERSVDADREVIGFYCNFKPQTHEAHGAEIILSQSKAADSAYTGVNAFNRQIRVTRRDVYRVSLLVTHVPDNGVFIKDDATLAVPDIPSAPGKYKQDYEQIEVGVVFTLRAPYADNLIAGTNPTISAPLDLTVRTQAVAGQLLRMYVFRKGAAQPFATFAPDEYRSWDGSLAHLSLSKVSPDPAQ